MLKFPPRLKSLSNRGAIVKTKYQLNTAQQGEALELLSEIKNNSVSLVIFDPQYEKAGDMTPALD